MLTAIAIKVLSTLASILLGIIMLVIIKDSVLDNLR